MNKTYCFLSMSSTMFPPQSNPVIVLLFTEATKASHSHVLIKSAGLHSGYTGCIHFIQLIWTLVTIPSKVCNQRYVESLSHQWE